MTDYLTGDPLPVAEVNMKPREHLIEEPLVGFSIPISSARYSDGDPINATGAAGDPKLTSGGWGSGSLTIDGEAASGNTKTETIMFERRVPENFVSAGDFKLVINAYYAAASSPVLTVKTLDVEAYADDGSNVLSDLCTTAAQDLTTSNVAYTFVITSTSLAAGYILRIFVRTVFTETAGGANTATPKIRGIKATADIKG